MPDAGGARRAAQHILAGPQFHAHPGRSFDPLGGVLNTIGRALAFVFTPIGHGLAAAFDWVARRIGAGVALALCLVALAVAVAALASLMLRRRARLGALRPERQAVRGEDPRQLDLDADSAEAAGDLETAVRLRFRAGLARLERGGLVAGRDTKTSADLAAVLRSPAFEQLAADLESIVYAGNEAGAEQAAAARALWPRVAEEAGRR
jgi:hypothetical protein